MFAYGYLISYVLSMYFSTPFGTAGVPLQHLTWYLVATYCMLVVLMTYAYQLSWTQEFVVSLFPPYQTLRPCSTLDPSHSYCRRPSNAPFKCSASD